MFGDVIEIDPHRNQRERIKTALAKLLTRAGDDAFVVFGDPETEKFVQFANFEGGLMLDLPFQALHASEMDRATKFFQNLGERLGQNPFSKVGDSQAFQVDFGKNVEEAAAMTYGIFELIYRLPPAFLLEIEES